MKLHHLRNATFVIESGEHHILIDPMLGDQGSLPPFAKSRHKPLRNPTVPLPESANDVLDRVTHCLITHSQKLGIESLRHRDHLDEPGVEFLLSRKTPVITCAKDAGYLKKRGLNVVAGLKDWQTESVLGGEVTAVPAIHGYGWVHLLMANGTGFFLRLPNEPSIYISGDTVYTKDVQKALTEMKPDIAVMASGSASLDYGGLLLMSLADLVRFVRDAPGRVVANHLEALNHCPTTRVQLREELEKNGLASKVWIPEDGVSQDALRAYPGLRG